MTIALHCTADGANINDTAFQPGTERIQFCPMGKVGTARLHGRLTGSQRKAVFPVHLDDVEGQRRAHDMIQGHSGPPFS